MLRIKPKMTAMIKKVVSETGVKMLNFKLRPRKIIESIETIKNKNTKTYIGISALKLRAL